jgi:Flp pilus assembly protein TadG
VKRLSFAINELARLSKQTPKRMRSSALRSGCRGHAVLEVALLSPWILFLFVGTFDLGFYTHALIATQNAARAGAAYTSRSSSFAANATGACRYALEELKTMSNVRNLTSCGTAPLIVTATALPAGVDGWPASSVSVTYQTNRLIPIPGLVGQLNITRTVQMLVK